MKNIELKNVNKVYGHGLNQVQALHDINFAAGAGEVTLILGQSGSGKSTFLTIAGGLQQPSSGQVIIDGVTTENMTSRQLDNLRLNKIGFVLQSYRLLPYLTVADQFRLVDRAHPDKTLSADQLQKMLSDLGVSQLLHHYPDQLSGGQNQRVSIARALYPDPPIVLADEPTSALDSQRVLSVGAAFQALAHERNKNVIIVTHDLRLKEFADRIFEINDGKIRQTQ